MRHLRRAWNRLAGSLGRGPHDDELAAEIEAHIELQADEYIRAGMAPEAARRRARLSFGSVESIKESYRDQRGLAWFDHLARDARQALRGMRREPGFTTVAVLSLALGIGATTALFSVVNSTLLRRLPYQHPESLALVSLSEVGVTAPHYLAFRKQARSLTGSALFRAITLDLVGGGEPERVQGAEVSATLFPMLGVQPQLGRAFASDEDQPGREHVVLLGDRLWRASFCADPRVIGRTVRLDDEPYTVIGVMPPGVEFPSGPELPAWAGALPPAEFWRPLAPRPEELACASCFNFALVARLRGGVAPRQAEAELDSIAEAVRTAWQKEGRPRSASVTTLAEALGREIRTPVLILFGAAALALLIACANVASLMLARGLRRAPELAMRTALGASRGRLLAQLLTEALVLALAAGALAIPVAVAATRALIAIAPANLRGIGAVGFEPRVLLFTLVVALASTLVFGALPALHAAWRAPAGGQERTMTAAPSRLRRLLVVGEIALSLLLVVGASLLLKGFLNVARTPLGFREEHLITMQLSLPKARYDKPQRPVVVEQLVRDCGALASVDDVAAVSTLPLTQSAEGWGVRAEDSPAERDFVTARVRAVTPSYFRTLGIRLRAGREFTRADDGTSSLVIVSEGAARRLWPGVKSPLGRRLDRRRMQVVGVVGDTHASGLDQEVLPYIYVPFSQFAPQDFALVVRTGLTPAQIIPAIKAEIWKMDKDRPVTKISTMKQLVAGSIAARRFQTLLMTVFAAFALALAALGIHGVIAYSVEQRRHEIGIRLALGASRLQVLRGVLKESGLLALAGTALGVLASLALTPLLESLLYGVRAGDRTALAISAALLLAVALLASLLPARRAARLDPMDCLRHE
jgi:putative ABC transport system permease protein